MKAISFRLGGKDVAAQLDSQVKRSDLYGRSAKLVLGPHGKALQQGLLTQNGALLDKSEFSSLTVDAKGSFVGSATYVRERQPVEAKPSSFKETRELEAVDMAALNEFAVDSVYPIVPEGDLMPGLYRTVFNYVAAIEPRDCLILIRKDGPSFLFAGSALEFAPVGKAVIYNLFDADEEEAEEESGDFDFAEMF